MGLRDWLKTLWHPDRAQERLADVDTPQVWTLTRRKRDVNAARVFRALARLLPPHSFIRFEGVSIARDVKGFFASNPADVVLDRRRDTLWPGSYLFHIPASTEVLAALVKLSKSHASDEICDNIIIYQPITDDCSHPKPWSVFLATAPLGAI